MDHRPSFDSFNSSSTTSCPGAEGGCQPLNCWSGATAALGRGNCSFLSQLWGWHATLKRVSPKLFHPYWLTCPSTLLSLGAIVVLLLVCPLPCGLFHKVLPVSREGWCVVKAICIFNPPVRFRRRKMSHFHRQQRRKISEGRKEEAVDWSKKGKRKKRREICTEVRQCTKVKQVLSLTSKKQQRKSSHKENAHKNSTVNSCVCNTSFCFPLLHKTDTERTHNPQLL